MLGWTNYHPNGERQVFEFCNAFTLFSIEIYGFILILVEGRVSESEKSRENDSRLYSTWQIRLAGEEAGGEILDLSTIFSILLQHSHVVKYCCGI